MTLQRRAVKRLYPMRFIVNHVKPYKFPYYIQSARRAAREAKDIYDIHEKQIQLIQVQQFTASGNLRPKPWIKIKQPKQ